MGEKRQISLAEVFQIIYVDTLLLRSEMYNSLLLKCELCIVTFFQRVQYGEGRREGVILHREIWQTLCQPGHRGQHQQ